MKKARITVRFNIFSKSDEVVLNYEKIKKLLPKPNSSNKKGDKRVLSDERIHPNNYKETAYNFESVFMTFDIEEVHKKWLNFWLDYSDELKNIKDEYKINFHLSYEIIVYEMNYPSLYFPVNFSSFLSDIGIVFSIYFYND